ncbi:MAG: hypothetical protein GY754_01850 [bacterium]|nr:hypothetical protein [bacterium]
MPGIMLAKEKGCEVDGITASVYQKDEALKLAKAEGGADRARFIAGDANKLRLNLSLFLSFW